MVATNVYYVINKFWIPPTWDATALNLNIFVKRAIADTVSFRAVIDSYLNNSTTASLYTKYVTWNNQNLSGNARVNLTSNLLALGVFGTSGAAFDTTNGGYISVALCSIGEGAYVEEMRLKYSTTRVALTSEVS